MELFAPLVLLERSLLPPLSPILNVEVVYRERMLEGLEQSHVLNAPLELTRMVQQPLHSIEHLVRSVLLL